MNPTYIPTPDTIPVHWGWFQILLTVTFLLHLLLMNTLLGGTLFAFIGRLRKRSPMAGRKALPTLVALTVNFGVPPLLFVQVLYGHLFYSSSVLMGVYWLSVIPILILAYYALYLFIYKGEAHNGIAVLTLGVASLFLLVIAFLFVNNLTLMLTPERWTAYMANPNGTILNLSDPTLYPRYLHFVIGSIAVFGLMKAVFHHIRLKRSGLLDIAATDENEEALEATEELATPKPENQDDDEEHEPTPEDDTTNEIQKEQDAISDGLKLFAYATMAQIVIGFWFLIALPKDIMMLFMGESIGYTILLLLGIALALLLVFFAMKNKLWLTFGTLVATMLLMIIQRDLVRAAYLGKIFSPVDLEILPQFSPLILFLVTFIAGLGIIFYMVKAIWLTGGREEA